jgi:hypothetical protein
MSSFRNLLAKAISLPGGVLKAVSGNPVWDDGRVPVKYALGYEYANWAAMAAATGFVAGDVGREAHLGDMSAWRVVNVNAGAALWRPVSQAAPFRLTGTSDAVRLSSLITFILAQCPEIPVEIYPYATEHSGGSAEQTLLTVPVPTGTVVNLKATVVGYSAGGEYCACTLVGTYKNVGGTITALVDNAPSTPWYLQDAAWDPNLEISSANVLVKATPDASYSTQFTVSAHIEIAVNATFAAATPGDFPSCISWFEAGLGVELGGGGNAAAWRDQGPNGLDLAQITQANQVPVATNIFGSEPALYFNGNVWLDSAVFTAKTQPCVWLAVVKSAAAASPPLVVFDTINGGSGQALYWSSSANKVIFTCGSNLTTSAAMSSGKKYAIAAVANGNSSSVRFAGTTDTGAAGAAAFTKIRVGASSGGGLNWGGYIAAIGCFSGSTVPSDVSDYILAKYGVTVGAAGV